MVVQHNLQAMNANRMLGITQGTVASATEKLSSGYRINRAADDAAGLSISEKMRKQIRGLDQASSNSEDGISCVQTAEGALAEVQDMLQRMNELCVQAANGTNSSTDRQYIQNELDQLISEIDRVSETTKFNEIYLLKGDSDVGTTKVYTADYAVTYTKNSDSTYKVNYTGEDNLYFVNTTSLSNATVANPVSPKVITKGDDVTDYVATVTIPKGKGNGVQSLDVDTTYTCLRNATLDTNKLEEDNNGKLVSNDTTDAGTAYFYDTATKSVVKVDAGEDLSDYIEYDGITVSTARVKDRYRLLTSSEDETLGGAADKSKISAETNKSITQLYDANGKEVSAMELTNYLNANGKYTGGLYTSLQATTTTSVTAATFGDYVGKTSVEISNNLSFDLHVGADSDSTNKITADIASMSSAGLGVNRISSDLVGIVDDSGANATAAIDVIAEAIQRVSTQRSALGAIQNRLEHTIKNLDNVVENTTAAESQIRDTDMAEEMVRYSNNNVLQQAGQSMLAQANQANQGILSLLQ